MTDLYAAWDAKKAPPPAPARRYANLLPQGEDTPYGLAAVQGECDTLIGTGEGSRNHQLNIAAVKAAGHYAGGSITEATAKGMLTDAAHKAGLGAVETRKTIESGWRQGVTQPHVRPTGNDSAFGQPATTQPARGNLLGVALDVSDATSDEDTADSIAAQVRMHLPLIDWHALWLDEEDEEWILDPLLPARRLIALYSPPKVGKSLLMLEIAAGIARGVSVLGYTPDRARRVLYVDFENDPRGDIRSRLRNMDLGPDDLADLCYLSFPALAALDTERGSQELEAAVKAYACEVVVIDTVSRAVQGEENENDTWLDFYRLTGVKMKRAGVAMIRLDHTGKDESKGQRGASAKVGDVDAVWKLTRVTDGAHAGGPETFRLTCEANRFPLNEADKLITIERHEHPLRHVVNPRGSREALEGELRAWLRDAGIDLDTDVRREVWPAARDAGIKASLDLTKQVVRELRHVKNDAEEAVS